MYRIHTPEALASEGINALNELREILGPNDAVELYEIKIELNEPISAKLAVIDSPNGPVIGDASWIWDGTRWGSES